MKIASFQHDFLKLSSGCNHYFDVIKVNYGKSIFSKPEAMTQSTSQRSQQQLRTIVVDGHTLSFAEALRFEAIIESTIDELLVVQTMHKPELNEKEKKNMSREDFQIFVKDNRLIDQYLNELINLLTETTKELDEKQTWNILKNDIKLKMNYEKEINSLKSEIINLIENRKKVENDILIERKQFKIQRLSMIHDINILEKRYYALHREIKENISIENNTNNAQRKSIQYLHETEINNHEKISNELSANLLNEDMIHEYTKKYLDKQLNDVILTQIENTKLQNIKENKNADKLISDLKLELTQLQNKYNEVNEVVTKFETDKAQQLEKEKLIEQQKKEFEKERRKTVTTHVLQKIIAKFDEKNNPKKTGKKKKKKTKKKKVKKKK